MEFGVWFMESAYPELRVGTLIFVVTLAIVYISGRMLNILKKDWSKNLLAVISSYGFATFYILTYLPTMPLLELIWNVVFKGSIGILLYVLVGFKLYSRADHLLDKKICED